MRRLAPILVLAALAVLAAVALAQVGKAPAARLTATAAAGAFEVTNSDDGQPVFAAANIAPGGAAYGTVAIADTGSAPADLVLRRGAVVDSPGLGGGVLSDRLRLTILDVTARGEPRTVYSGPLATMPDQPAGQLEPGEARTFEFTATLPDAGGPSFQNAVQGASTTVAYAWIAEEATAGGERREPGGGQEGGNAPDGSGGGGGGTPPANGSPAGGPSGNGGAAGVVGHRAVLKLTVPKVRRKLRSGSLLVWARCDETCRVSVTGRLRASAADHHHVVRIRSSQGWLKTIRPQRMRIPIPRKLRAWLRHQPRPQRMRANLCFTAIGTDGQRAVVRKKVRLRAVGRPR